MRLVLLFEVLFVVGLGILAIWGASAAARRLDERRAQRRSLYRATWTFDGPRLAQVREILATVGEQLEMDMRGAANRLEDVFREAEVGQVEIAISLYRRA